MTAAQIMQKMFAFSEGNIQDIDHFIRVWTYARTIGELEQLDEETQFVLEAAAITHNSRMKSLELERGEQHEQ